MLSFRLKIAWFVLSLTGTGFCAIVLWAFGRVAGSKWGPMLYCAGNVVLQGIFCLGMIYRMDPFAMPRSFCMAQSILLTFGTDVLTGVTIAFSMATYTTVLKPKTWNDGRRALQWRNAYMLPMVVFPAVGTAIHIILVVELDALHPSDGMHCDATTPQWTRMFGFAGVPFLMTLPSIYLSTTSILQIHKTNKHLQRARPDSLVSEFKRSMSVSMPRNNSSKSRNKGHSKSRRVSFIPPAAVAVGADVEAGRKSKRRSEGREAIAPAISSPTLLARKFHLPFGGPRVRTPIPTAPAPAGVSESKSKSDSAGRELGDEYHEDDDDDDDKSSRVSVTFPTFVNPHATPTPTSHTAEEGWDLQHQQDIELPEVDGATNEMRNSWRRIVKDGEAEVNTEDMDMGMGIVCSSDSATGDSGGDWTVEDDLDLDPDSKTDLGDIYALSEAEPYKGKAVDSLSASGNSMPGRRQRRPHPSLAPAIRWLISFQLLFIFVQVLASLSVFIDVVTHRASPTPFGTHYVALLLAAWGPVFIFGPISAVRHNLIPWRPLAIS